MVLRCSLLLLLLSPFTAYSYGYIYKSGKFLYSSRQIAESQSFIAESNFNKNFMRHEKCHPIQLPRHTMSLNMLEEHSFEDIDVEASDLYAEETEVPMESSPMRQLKLEFNCDVIDSDELSEVILELGPLSVSVEAIKEKDSYLNDESKWGDLQKTRSWATALLRVNFPSSYDVDGVIETIKEIYGDQVHGEIVENVENIDWVSEVQKEWKPQIIDDLTIKFPWHSTLDVANPTLHNLVLEGGAAFGTGDHPTTRLCTRWLSQNIKSMREGCEVKSIDVLDYGCGSAILGLAALRYGATRAVGVDIDKDALVSAKNNCQMNGLSMELYITSEEKNENLSNEERSILMNSFRGKTSEFEFADETAIGGHRFDLTVANILAPILINLAPILADYTVAGGKIALSGVVAKQADTVVATYSKYFENMSVEAVEGDWVLITGNKVTGNQ
jgi:ribosomal protein L11 methyltransferase